MDTNKVLVGSNRACWVLIPMLAAIVGTGMAEHPVEGALLGVVAGLILGRVAYWVIKGFLFGKDEA